MSASDAPLFGIAVFEDLRETLACTPVLRQLAMAHPDASIVWFTRPECAAALRNNRWIDEIIELEGTSDELYGQVDELRASAEWTQFLTPSLSRNRARFQDAREWEVIQLAADVHWAVPFVFEFELSDAEVLVARRYWERLPAGPKILVETEHGLAPEDWSAEWLEDLVDAFGSIDPTFVFVADGVPTGFGEIRRRWPKSVWCREPFRLCAEFVNLCDVFVGVNGPLSVLSYSSWCRRDVPHIECVPEVRSGPASLRMPEDVWMCIDRQRYREALAAVAARLRGDFDADLTPRHDLRADGPVCPSCGGVFSTSMEGQRGFFCCAECELMFAENVPAKQPDPPLTPAAREQQRLARLEHLRCALTTWRGPLERGMLVEIGCRGTEVLRAANERGLVATGWTDDAQTLANVEAESLGIRRGDLESARLEPDSVSILLVAHELQRQVHPFEYLERVQHVLEPGGIAYLTMPNLQSLGHAVEGEEWPWLRRGGAASHALVGFLRRAAALLGMVVEVLETTPGEFDPDHLRRVLERIKPGVRPEVLDTLVMRCCQAGQGEEIRVVLRKRGVSKTRTTHAIEWGRSSERFESESASSRIGVQPVVSNCR